MCVLRISVVLWRQSRGGAGVSTHPLVFGGATLPALLFCPYPGCSTSFLWHMTLVVP